MIKLLSLFSLFSLALSQQIPHDSACVVVQKWTDLEWTVDTKEFCSFTCSRTCEQRKRKVCTNVPSKECELVPYTDCVTEKTNVDGRLDKVESIEFVPRSCEEDEIKFITEIKMMPICENVTKESCDSTWEVDPITGAG